MEKFVKGGSDNLGLQPEGKRKRRTVLSESQKEALYRQHLMGEKAADLAAAYDINIGTVYTHIANMRKKEKGMAFSPKVIAGNKKTGRLVYANNAGDKYEASHLTSDGEMHHLKFTAKNNVMARQRYDKWCSDLDDECAFLSMVERKPLNDTEKPIEVEEHTDEPKVVCGHPGDPVEEIRPIEEPDITPAPVPEVYVRPWREVAEERQKRIEELEAELKEAKTQRIEFAEGFQMEMHNPIYVIWSKCDEPKIYGAYLTMDEALKEVDKLNDVAAFLGNKDAFEAEEVPWR